MRFSPSSSARLEATVREIPRMFPGPGGALAVLKDGREIASSTWGYANVERRIPFTAQTLFRICSFTKQFTCSLLLDRFADVSVLDADVRSHLPKLPELAPTALNLCHNQSGLRDYWAVAMLQGPQPESVFGELEARRLIAATRSLHFAPGTRYSYSNQNFRILCDILENRTGRSFAELLRTQIFDRVGMPGALLAADTQSMPDGTVGYEGSASGGFRPAENRIFWTGDAGMGATLEDMIAWESHIDQTRDDPESLYRRLSAPVTFADGQPASYSFGLSHSKAFGRTFTGHGGQLRGWRSYRLYVPSERVSVVVMFNHMCDARSAALTLLGSCLDAAPPSEPDTALPDWRGAYLDSETGTLAHIATNSTGQQWLRFGDVDGVLRSTVNGIGTDGCELQANDGGLQISCPSENVVSSLRRCEGPPAADLVGRFHCAEIDAELTVNNAGGVLFGGFSGGLGTGRMEMLQHAGGDVWALPCPRALDQPPPGDWTLVFERNQGRVSEVRVGCWLARHLRYRPVE
ncbi:D-aminopeptidase [Steroidobacter sp.]|uniref:D-aminopeptidase n=1 Tax=Steroidobacter sp. TaxID=1978227 RepID=UPI001A3D00C2|nr:D-aminopeptidase [Steroidobacter sp.]MBL8265663.1 D-aminopeptidase [Steroidobacter sp.]